MSTKFDAEAIASAGQNIGLLLNDMSVFEALKQPWPTAGRFEPAARLGWIMDGQRGAVVAHADRLKSVFGDMETKLKAISGRLKKTDGQNAEEIQNAFTGLEGAL